MNDERSRHDRQLDMTSLKALAHPLRVQILDTLSQYGPATSSGLAERLGESSGATSYHLRQLAKHDFVREVTGRGSARERWWERSPGGISLNPREVAGTVAGRAVSDMVMRQWQQNKESLVMDFLMHGLDVLPGEWTDVSTTSSANLRLTVDQLRELTEDLSARINEIADRYRGKNDPGSRPVQVQFNAFPLIDGEVTAVEETAAEETAAEETAAEETVTEERPS
jgi:DNA-binding transcriptional ArsR family regulator